MKYETMRIYFLSEFSVCCHPKILLPWQHDVTTSLYYNALCIIFSVTCVIQVMSATRAVTFTSELKNTTELQSKPPEGSAQYVPK